MIISFLIQKSVFIAVIIAFLGLEIGLTSRWNKERGGTRKATY